jgi:hypothetical protein
MAASKSPRVRSAPEQQRNQMNEPKSIEVFQDLTLRDPAGDRHKLRLALIERVSPPWVHSEEAEKRLASRTVLDGDILVFQRTADDHLPAASLTLWSRLDGYEVTNIVPREIGELGYAKYNALLQEFVRQIAMPAASSVGYSVETTAAQQSLEEWTSPEVAKALQYFSLAANKSTGSSHPLDEKRWLKFLIKAHVSGKKIGADRLGRWLTEVEGWDDDHAHELVIEYEFALDLLREYDSERS